MLKITCILFSLLLSGCVWQTVNEGDLRKAAKICQGFDKVEEISATWWGEEQVKCQGNRWLTM